MLPGPILLFKSILEFRIGRSGEWVEVVDEIELGIG
jgi:hypothetical protein